MAFQKGHKVIEQDEKAQAEARKAALSDRLDYLTIGENETVFIRFITPGRPDANGNAWLKVAQHSYVKTKPKPEGYNNWAKSMSAVCRYDSQIGYDDCYICDNQLPSAYRDEFAKPMGRVWAIAALRHQIRGDGTEAMGGKELEGRLLGMDDVREEYEILDKDKKPTGKKAERIKFVLVNMTWKQVFATFASAEDNYEGGATGRDFAIRKTGEKPNYEYHVLALDPIYEDEDRRIMFAPGSKGWERYTDELKRREIDLEDIVLKLASDEHYAHWFDPTKKVEKGKIVSSGATIPEDSAKVFTGEYPPKPVDGDEGLTPEGQKAMDAMRARLMG